MVKILLVEDNPGDVYLIEDYLEEFANFSYELRNVATFNEALSALKEQPFDIILSDLSLPDSDGIDTFFRIRDENPLIPIIVLSGTNDIRIRFQAVEKGALDFLVKGQMGDRLLECIKKCINTSKKI